MKESLILDFEIPIWKVFFNGSWPHSIPYEFSYRGKKYTNGITILHFAWYVPHFVEHIRVNLHKYRNPILCAPDEEIKKVLENANLNCLAIVLAGHNAFIDENFYTIKPEINRIFNFVCNSAFRDYKNRHWQNNVSNIVHIGYFQEGYAEHIPANGYCPNFNSVRAKYDWKPLSPEEVCNAYNQSRVGLILSEVEGSCYSSGEYMLCGLPVVSVRCWGGRQHWYNSTNSIVCQPNSKSVEDACASAIQKLNTGEFDPYKIRQGHIDEMNRQRNNLLKSVLHVFSLITPNIPDQNKLFNRLKVYHSNTSFKKDEEYNEFQFSDELAALTVLGVI